MNPTMGAIVLTIKDNWKILFWIIVPNYGILFFTIHWLLATFHFSQNKNCQAAINSLSESKIILHLILFFKIFFSIVKQYLEFFC